jgi:type I restriction enzyme, S subunit
MKSTHLRWLCQNLDFLRVPLNATERAERQGNVPYWGANGVVDYVDEALVDEPVVLIGEDGAPFFERYKEVAFCTDGKIWPNNHIHILRPNRHIMYDRFLCYFLNHVDYAKYVNGSTRDKLTQAQLGSITINYPGLENQKAIADFLDRETARIDQLIERREAFLSLIDEKKASLAVKAVDGSILEGVAKGIEGWFGVLPESWQVKRAKLLFRERQERSESGEEELLTVSHITGVTRRSDKDVNMFLAESTEGYKLVSEGDVVVNTMWAWMGAMGISPVEGLISPSYGVYAPRGDAFEADYLDLLLRSRPFVAEATRRSKGIHSSRLRLYPDAFLDIRLPVPSREAQRAILTALKAATEREEQLANLSRLSLDRLREFRSALITAAVTGQIDVATWGKRGTTDRRLEVVESNMPAAAQPERQQARA